MKRLTLSVLILLLVISLSSCGYNRFQSLDEKITSAWSEVLNQYKRRADLIPNLIEVVKGYAEHEKEVFIKVTEARSKVNSMTVDAALINNPEALKQFEAAQQQLKGALSRLMLVAERYPNLKADGRFADFQAQLEGTENRITVARGRYIKAVESYNILARSFPSNLTAMMFGYERKANFSVENEQAIAEPPKVAF